MDDLGSQRSALAAIAAVALIDNNHEIGLVVFIGNAAEPGVVVDHRWLANVDGDFFLALSSTRFANKAILKIYKGSVLIGPGNA